MSQLGYAHRGGEATRLTTPACEHYPEHVLVGLRSCACAKLPELFRAIQKLHVMITNPAETVGFTTREATELYLNIPKQFRDVAMNRREREWLI